jgi:hypothetical protein
MVASTKSMRTRKSTAIIICVALALLCGLGAYWFARTMTICDTGSPRPARQWAALLESAPDIEAARRADQNVWGTTFADGEWVFGLSHDSHGSPWTGGTVVCRDSRHGVRVFFGHVCGGPGPLWWKYNFEDVQSLDRFYARLEARWLKEQPSLPK